MRLKPLVVFGLLAAGPDLGVSRDEEGLPILVPAILGIPVIPGGNNGDRGVWLVTSVESDVSDHRLSFIFSRSAGLEVLRT